MADTWRQSMESKMANGAEDDELLAILDPEKQDQRKHRRSSKLSNGESNLVIAGKLIEATSRVKITDDSSGSCEESSDLIEESEIDEGVEEIATSLSEEEHEEDFRVGDRFLGVCEDSFAEEEEFDSTESRSGGREKVDDDSNESTERTESDDTDIGILADIPVEILRDRQAVIEKLRELRKDEPGLKRKNRLLQYWVARVMTKKHRTMMPEDEISSGRERDDEHLKKLISYKTTIDEIAARRDEIKNELENLENNLGYVLEEDSLTFGQLLDREREIGVGLVSEKSGRAIGVRGVEAAIRRQVLRRNLLNRDRFKYIFYRHRYDDVKTKLRLAETLGDGMTIMDYEMISMENDTYKEKLEDREKELEKLYVKIQNILNQLAHYKEREVANATDIFHEEKHLEIVRSETLKSREGLSEARQALWRTRRICENKKRRAGMLFAVPAVREMERMLKTLDNLKLDIETIMRKDAELTRERRRKMVGAKKDSIGNDENRTRKMSGVKSSLKNETRRRCRSITDRG